MAPAALLGSPFLKSGCERRSTYGKFGSKTSLVKNTHNCRKLKECWKLHRNLRALMAYGVWKCGFFMPMGIFVFPHQHVFSYWCNYSPHSDWFRGNLWQTIIKSDLLVLAESSFSSVDFPVRIKIGASLPIFSQWKENKANKNSKWKTERNRFWWCYKNSHTKS